MNTLSTRKLTAKQRKWIKVYQETLNATEAAMQVYNCKDRNSANAIGAENLAKLSFDDLMDAVNLTEETLMLKLKDKLNAQDSIIVEDKGKKQILKVDNHNAQLKALELSLKLKGKLSNKLEVTGKDGEPLRMEVLAGIAHLPPKDDRNSDPDTKPEGDAQVATSGFVPRSTEIQDADLAQTSQKDNDSTE